MVDYCPAPGVKLANITRLNLEAKYVNLRFKKPVLEPLRQKSNDKLKQSQESDSRLDGKCCWPQQSKNYKHCWHQDEHNTGK